MVNLLETVTSSFLFKTMFLCYQNYSTPSLKTSQEEKVVMKILMKISFFQPSLS